MEIQYRNDRDNAMYSDSVVLSTIWICSLEAHMIGQHVYIVV